MATYQFSALSDGQAISFNPTADVLNFDQSAIAAADIRVTASGTSTRIDVIAGPQAGKDITLLNTTPFQLAMSNVNFVDGSRLLIGDNSTATGDDNGNTLNGGTGRDLIFAFGGSDTINIGTANYGGDHIDGGADFDTLNFNGYVTAALTIDFSAGTISSSGGNATFANIERVIGGAGNDSISGAAGSQNLTSVGGNDTLWGAGGVDTLWSGIGVDVFLFREVGTANADNVGDFTSGTDKVALDGAVMTALGVSGNFAAGDARFWAAAGATSGHDADDRVVYNTTTRQVFYDADGNGSGPAQLIATLQIGATLTAADIVVTGSARSVVGAEGEDTLVGTGGNDTIEGRGGNDRILGMGGSDSINGGDGNDEILAGRFEPSGDIGGDILVGGNGDDTLDADNSPFASADPNADTLDGGLGNDVFHVDNGADVLLDAGGVDTIIAHGGWTLGAGFENLHVYNDEQESAATGIGNELDNRLSIGWTGRLEGRGGDDTIVGGPREDQLLGEEGNDSIVGGGHFDLIDGGVGNDTLTGGGFEDAFNFSVSPNAANADAITDFTSGFDYIRLDGSVMTAVGSWGQFRVDDARFYAAAGATGGHDADDRVIYNTTTRQLFYDADGSGSGAAQLIATLQSDAALVATDIAVGNGTVITGTLADDSLVGTSGNDSINGLAGNDTIDGTGGNDTIHGNDGSDSLTGGDGNDWLIAGTGADDNGDSNTLIGGAGDDRLTGVGPTHHFPTADTLDGGLGNDVFEVGEGDVVLDAGGVDEVVAVDRDWTLAAGFEHLNMYNYESERSVTGIGNELDNRMTLYRSGRLEGRGGNDTLSGGHNESELFGGDGNDFLVAANHGGALDGGAGNDTLSAGFSGADFSSGTTFVFSAPAGTANADHIADFTSAEDTIRLVGSSYSSVGFEGELAAGDERFYSAAGASAGHDADDRIVFDTSSGNLWLDADGSGSGAAQLIATLQPGAVLAATDITVIGEDGGMTIVGTNGNDNLIGTDGDDTMFGLAGNDTLDGSRGLDVLDGGAGDDLLMSMFGMFAVGGDASVTGGDGNDTMIGGGGPMDGGLGNDTYEIWSSTPLTDAGGIDTVIAVHMDWTLAVGFENLTGKKDPQESGFGPHVTFIGNDAANVIDASEMRGATIEGRGGNDTLLGGWFEDGQQLYGGDGNDSLRGASNSDILDGGAGIDTMDGGAGDDSYYVTVGDVIVSDPGGIDTVVTAVSWNISSGTIDNVTMTGTSNVSVEGNNLANRIVGNDAPNYINARAGSDTITGNGGNDTFNMSRGGTASFGNDSIDGGAGVDTVEFGVNALTGLVADLGAGTVTGGEAGGAGSSTVLNIERFIAGDFNDSVAGSGAANYIDARAGNDTVSGAAGNDTLIGGTGNDRLAGGTGVDSMTGGAGLDSFVFAEAPGSANADRITDFVLASDKVLLDDAFHANIGALGNFAAGDARFWAAAGATSGHDATDRVIYNTSTGSLYYDADGSGAGAAQLIATFTGNPAIAATDIGVI